MYNYHDTLKNIDDNDYKLIVDALHDWGGVILGKPEKCVNGGVVTPKITIAGETITFEEYRNLVETGQISIVDNGYDGFLPALGIKGIDSLINKMKGDYPSNKYTLERISMTSINNGTNGNTRFLNDKYNNPYRLAKYAERTKNDNTPHFLFNVITREDGQIGHGTLLLCLNGKVYDFDTVNANALVNVDSRSDPILDKDIFKLVINNQDNNIQKDNSSCRDISLDIADSLIKKFMKIQDKPSGVKEFEKYLDSMFEKNKSKDKSFGPLPLGKVIVNNAQRNEKTELEINYIPSFMVKHTQSLSTLRRTKNVIDKNLPNLLGDDIVRSIEHVNERYAKKTLLNNKETMINVKPVVTRIEHLFDIAKLQKENGLSEEVGTSSFFKEKRPDEFSVTNDEDTFNSLEERVDRQKKFFLKLKQEGKNITDYVLSTGKKDKYMGLYLKCDEIIAYSLIENNSDKYSNIKKMIKFLDKDLSNEDKEIVHKRILDGIKVLGSTQASAVISNKIIKDFKVISTTGITKDSQLSRFRD